MNNHSRLFLVIALLGLTGTTPAQSINPVTTGALRVPANRIVGLWASVVQIGPCIGGRSPPPFSATGVFSAGGTLSSTDTFPTAGVPNLHGVPGINTHGNAFGTWKYNWRTRRYTVDMRFNWYVNGIYNGYQQIHRNIVLSSHSRQADSIVTASRHRADGSKIADFCGSEHAERL